MTSLNYIVQDWHSALFSSMMKTMWSKYCPVEVVARANGALNTAIVLRTTTKIVRSESIRFNAS